MASFADMLNQGLGALTGTPLGQFGTQMLLASGPQANNPGFGARLGQAVQGMGQQQLQQQQLEQTNMLRQIQQATMMRQMQQMKQEQDAREGVRTAVQNDPTLLANNPMARQILSQTGDVGMAGDIAKLGGGGPKPPTMKQTYDQYNPDGTVTQQIYDYQTGQYKQGATYTPTAQQRVNLEQEFRPQEFGLKKQNADTVQANAGTAQGKLELAQSKEAREAAKALRESNLSQEQLRQGYTGATAQIDETIADAQRLMDHPGFNSLFGPNGMIQAVPGTSAADAKALYDQFVSKIGFSELQRLKQMGISLTPTSNVDVENAQKSAASIARSQSDAGARQSLNTFIDKMKKARGEATTNFDRMSSLYQQPAQQQQQQAPQRINDDAGYDALPSGATFIAPDGSMRRKP